MCIYSRGPALMASRAAPGRKCRGAQAGARNWSWPRGGRRVPYIYIYIYTYTHIYPCICISLSLSLYIYIYIYTHVCPDPVWKPVTFGVGSFARTLLSPRICPCLTRCLDAKYLFLDF